MRGGFKHILLWFVSVFVEDGTGGLLGVSWFAHVCQSEYESDATSARTTMVFIQEGICSSIKLGAN